MAAPFPAFVRSQDFMFHHAGTQCIGGALISMGRYPSKFCPVRSLSGRDRSVGSSASRLRRSTSSADRPIPRPTARLRGQNLEKYRDGHAIAPKRLTRT